MKDNKQTNAPLKNNTLSLSQPSEMHQVITVSIKSSKDGIQMFLSAQCPLASAFTGSLRVFVT